MRNLTLAILMLFSPQIVGQPLLSPYLDVLGGWVVPSEPMIPCPNAEKWKANGLWMIELEVGDFADEKYLEQHRFRFDPYGNWAAFSWKGGKGDTIISTSIGKPDSIHYFIPRKSRKEKDSWKARKYHYDRTGAWVGTTTYQKIEGDRYGWYIHEKNTRGYKDGQLDSIHTESFKPNGRLEDRTTKFFVKMNTKGQDQLHVISGPGLNRETLNILLGAIGPDFTDRAIYFLDKVYTQEFRKLEDSISMTFSDREYGRWARDISRRDSASTREVNLLSRRKINWKTYHYSNDGVLEKLDEISGDRIVESSRFFYDSQGRLSKVKALDYKDGYRKIRFTMFSRDAQGRISRIDIDEEGFEMYSTVFASFEKSQQSYDVVFFKGRIDKFVRKDGFYFDVRQTFHHGTF